VEPEEAKKIALFLMEQYGLTENGWTFKWLRVTTVLIMEVTEDGKTENRKTVWEDTWPMFLRQKRNSTREGIYHS